MKKLHDFISPESLERPHENRAERKLGKVARARLAFEDMRRSVEPSSEEISRPLPGDELIPDQELGVNIVPGFVPGLFQGATLEIEDTSL